LRSDGKNARSCCRALDPVDTPEVVVKRRELLRAAGAATVLSLLPQHADAAWARVLAGHRAADGLSAAQRALVSGIADIIFPRTDTPSATDVGVTEWVDLIVAEYQSADVRKRFTDGLDAIDAQVRSSRGRAFSELDANAQREIVGALDVPNDRQAPDARAYAQLKSLVVHGYFTSERVQRDVLKTRMFYGRFEGAADMPARPAR
jgi:hypothetical protein